MSIVDGLWVFVLGALAVPNLVLSKRPDAKRILDRITPYQGWIGVISALWGLIRIPYLISALSWLRLGFRGLLGFILVAAFVITQTGLGFILGVGVMKHFVKDAKAQLKLDEVLGRILPYQATLGIIAMIDGVAIVLFALLVW